MTFTHTEILSADDAIEPITRCAGKMVESGHVYDRDIQWTIMVCEKCATRVMTIGGIPNHLNYEMSP